MKKAVIENGIVTNIIEVPTGFKREGMILVRPTTATEIGGRWDGTKFFPAPVEPPPPERPTILALRELAAEIGVAAVAKIDARFGVKP